MTAMKKSVTDAVTANAEVAGDLRNRKTMTSLKVLKEIETDLESNSSSSDVEYYSPKSVVVKKFPVKMKKDNGSRVRIHNPIARIRSEDQVGEGYVTKFVYAGGDGRDGMMMFTRPVSPLGGKTMSFGCKE
ncbi:hypothetical protein HanRHA438_Chr15g0723041 [Helianthus annuus]|uniref:Uncharacterized protein n=1 Tax=Helianthus annuus TaxID=4232 RepID=A0A9K3H4P0_HELAN|nr:hypothetical protein HanXRQr2_Chr15g0710821 [Helianthus annuus]KAJ0457407.1 hypothetical protein HanIR_Chr15g0773441 [Helianthus annuus]KAJ0832737.1 hypothetical protein HanPSC8_Chr15g0682161 [Helianthus annuus]KAJ0846273.1 hypothetical protein HanRHA438_Chr15g0723041 [Helianthus annuus]